MTDDRRTSVPESGSVTTAETETLPWERERIMHLANTVSGSWISQHAYSATLSTLLEFATYVA